MSVFTLESGRWLSPAQASRLLGVTPQRIGQLLAEGKLQAVKTPLGHLVEVASVERLLAERRQARRRK